LDILNAIILGVVEGLTEFLPVSSTGHLVLTDRLLGLDAEQAPWNVLMWVSQFGAILAVIVYFWRALWRRVFHPAGSLLPPPVAWQTHLLTKLFVAMVPTVIIGLALKKHLDWAEKSPLAVAGALIVGAVIMELIDRRFRRERPQTLEDVTLLQAFWIGVLQCISIWPGVSRSGASIMGGMALGLSPTVATEFSFYLAIPTMLGAATLTLVKHRHELTAANASLVLLGSAVAFLVALGVVAWFTGYVKRRRFTPFAIYRVLLGAGVLVMYLCTKH